MAKRFLGGFTLIELIVVMAIIAILAAAAIVAINPGRRQADARNTKRQNDTVQILSAIQQAGADNSGVLPADVTSATSATCIGTDVACKDLSQELIQSAGNYLTAMPTDPSGGTTANTGYTVEYDGSTKRVTVAAPNAENSIVISKTQ